MRSIGSILGRCRAASIAIAVGLGVGIAASGAAAGEVEAALADSMADVEAGRCRDAVLRLEKIGGLASRAHALGGRCRVDQGDYEGALADFERAEKAGDLADAQRAEVELYRGVALYHLERYSEAEAALDRAEARSSGLATEDAQLSLYRGMIALRRGENEAAAPLLESAGRLDPDATEPVASYYAGLAWRDAAERTRAREAFERVIEKDPDGPWGKEADKLLESTELFPFYLRVRAGFEYDDNVLLRATGTDRVTRDGDKDWRGVWELEAGVQLFSVGRWAGGVVGSYSGSEHHELSDFDLHYPSIGTFVDYRFAPLTIGRLRYDYGFAWVDEKGFLDGHMVQGSVLHTWQRMGTTQFLVDAMFNDFRFENSAVADGNGAFACPAPNGVTGCSPPGVREDIKRNRDGFGIGVGLEHRYLVTVPDSIERAVESAELRGGYRFEYYDSQGTEWERFGHILSAGFKVEMPMDFSFDGSAAYEHYDYMNPSTFPDIEVADLQYALASEDREEDAFLVEAELEKDLNEFVSVSARYSYYDSASNRRVYDYRRHIVGGYVNFRFD